jgi:hypothetical protein
LRAAFGNTIRMHRYVTAIAALIALSGCSKPVSSTAAPAANAMIDDASITEVPDESADVNAAQAADAQDAGNAIDDGDNAAGDGQTR